jgi:hypothetical protein
VPDDFKVCFLERPADLLHLDLFGMGSAGFQGQVQIIESVLVTPDDLPARVELGIIHHADLQKSSPVCIFRLVPG